jgi:transcriptional regulator with XRE-family HTH domain
VEKPDKVASGQRLRRERINRSFSQEEVAEKIGSTATNVSRWELGYTAPTPYFRRKLCELFGKSPQELFPQELPPSPPPTRQQPPSEQNETSRRIPERGPEMVSVFRFNTSLTDAGEFYGRRGEWIPLLRRLRLHSSVSITGQRRIGKTWLLSYLRLVASTELGPGYHIGYIDATMPSCDTLHDLTASMLEVLHISSSGSSTTTEHLALLEKAVKELSEKKETLVLCIDEFEGLCDKPGFHMTILERLRAITNLGLSMVIASRHPLVSVIAQKVGKSGETSPFFNVFEQITLKPFIRKEAEAFARAKSKQAGFTEQEYASLLKYGQEEESKEQWPPLRLQLVGKMIEEDKILSAEEPLYPHLPSDPNYWQEFKVRLEEKYQGVVG